jgi:cytochrome c peroxidase
MFAMMLVNLLRLHITTTLQGTYLAIANSFGGLKMDHIKMQRRIWIPKIPGFAVGALALVATGFGCGVEVSEEEMPALSAETAAAEVPREGTCDNPDGLFPDNNPGPGSLKTLRPIEPPDLGKYVVNRRAAIALGKALFWDMQVGSDGIQACGSCHFRAGADPRSKNQLHPGGLNDDTFDLGGPNVSLKASDFPLHKLADRNDRLSHVLQSIDDVVSSQGVKKGDFVRGRPGAPRDEGVVVNDDIFSIDGRNTRRAEPRNTPTVFNAAFSRRTFWDGRADHIFNGRNEFGVRDPGARVVRADNPSAAALVAVRIEPGAMASQAVGPVVSTEEMSLRNRRFPDVARRLLTAYPLADQKVAWDDSHLAGFTRSTPGQQRAGLLLRYKDLVRLAFHPRWWNAFDIVDLAADGTAKIKSNPYRPLRDNEFTAMEYNFSLFFGLAIMLYENTLISDDTPMDRFFDGNPNALTAQQARGLAVFSNKEKAACSACHSGAETTNTSVRIIDGAIVDGVDQPGEVVERMFNGNCDVVLYDQSFYNIGVRPTSEDLGIGNKDPFGNPLGIVGVLTSDPAKVPSKELLAIDYPNIADPPPRRGERTSSMGAFKVPGLRNVALTAPYFHNGGQLTLRQVVEFYNRGGDFREANSQFVDFEIGRIGLTPQEVDDLVAFLEGGLTDQRVVRASAPFDHPQIFVPNGHIGDESNVRPDADGTAKDRLVEIPAVGRQGGPPLPGFLDW